ncbi:peptide chain release factor 3 [Salisediminibacterium selenitireducens]|uniref:Peptide chain release factor 3 n=1 Tax=Bacillus selenitireducens (strain ATCC 700615 / DSM 15326 / MLS10) TaxID=439292 RepID=D6XXJ7_BACIE|nr:peptide chain release factor 3 [Salisediminibacterium selenitireducens]ADI00040.1 peptide chain release factor 3 [[Bacillus] selenitireducens MLS10]
MSVLTTAPRRTFAIISHPDAGKTTLTEKLLLLGGSIRSAGTVKGKKSGKFATSDWMDIEKQRGISVTSSVMQLVYNDVQVNILDTPGHQDFSEDTYRTLTAVDTAVMVIDSVKGIESQTLKLFKVCRMRGIPILTYINKLDREGKEPLDLLSEIEETLEMETFPMNWPIGTGKRLKGIYDLQTETVETFNEGHNNRQIVPLQEADNLADYEREALEEEIMLLEEAGNEFSQEKVQNGTMTPVFFGSALANFGVQSFLDAFVDLASKPQPRKASGAMIDPEQSQFSGFIFKIQANMNPNHRDRIAFLRVCSGQFERGMEIVLSRTGKKMKLSQSHSFFASDRETVNSAKPGDIVGIYDSGNFQVGDTLIGGGERIQYEEMPQFPPEKFAKVTAKNAMKHKQYHKGIDQLVQEGTIQLYKTPYFEDYILGAVGELQFQVFEYRMKNEYNVDIEFNHMSHELARWVTKGDVSDIISDSRKMLVEDQQKRPVLLFENEFAMRWFQDKNPDFELSSGWDILE